MSVIFTNLDDFISKDNYKFVDFVDCVYPTEFEIKYATIQVGLYHTGTWIYISILTVWWWRMKLYEKKKEEIIWLCDKINTTVTTVGARHNDSSGAHTNAPLLSKMMLGSSLLPLCIVAGFIVYWCFVLFIYLYWCQVRYEMMMLVSCNCNITAAAIGVWSCNRSRASARF